MKCMYCGRRTRRRFCRDECERSYNEYLKVAEKWNFVFVIGITVSAILLLLPFFFGHALLFCGISVYLIGMLFAFFPYTVAVTALSFNIARTLRLMKVSGLLLVLFGIASTWLSLYL